MGMPCWPSPECIPLPERQTRPDHNAPVIFTMGASFLAAPARSGTEGSDLYFGGSGGQRSIRTSRGRHGAHKSTQELAVQLLLSEHPEPLWGHEACPSHSPLHNSATLVSATSAPRNDPAHIIKLLSLTKCPVLSPAGTAFKLCQQELHQCQLGTQGRGGGPLGGRHGRLQAKINT
eukprot:29023-Pelagomonas_calceolata.AAC.3